MLAEKEVAAPASSVANDPIFVAIEMSRSKWVVTKLFADETTAPVLDPGRGRTKKGYFWALARDDRPWRGGAPPAVVYTYAPGRSGEVAAALLKGYTGVLQTDGYTVYGQLADPKRGGGSLRQAFCWAHWRRQWFDLAKSPAPIATEALERIAALYRIEAEIRGSSAQERRAARQERSRPLVAALKAWLEKTLLQLPRGSTLAQVIRYGRGCFAALAMILESIGRTSKSERQTKRLQAPYIGSGGGRVPGQQRTGAGAIGRHDMPAFSPACGLRIGGHLRGGICATRSSSREEQGALKQRHPRRERPAPSAAGPDADRGASD